MCRKYSHIIFSLVLIVLFPWVPSSAQDVVRVERVVDGDTLLLTNGEKVRLIGIDAQPRGRGLFSLVQGDSGKGVNL